MGTFNLAWSISDGDAYGHVGDTYGYQSQTTYIPAFDFVISEPWRQFILTELECSAAAGADIS